MKRNRSSMPRLTSMTPSLVWTDERIAKLTTLWNSDIPFNRILEEMGATKGSVNGIAARLLLPKRTTRALGVRGATKSRARTRPSDPASPLPPPAELSGDPFADIPEVSEDYTSPPHSPAIEALMQLRADGCKWPIGDPRDVGFRFCNEVRSWGHRYCKTHIAEM